MRRLPLLSLALLLQALLASTAPSPQTTNAPSTNTCAADSKALKALTITALDFFNGNPLQAQSSSSSLTLSVRNPITSDLANCSAAGVALTPQAIGSDPYIWYQCKVDASEAQVTASIQFNALINEVSVNETWVCGDGTRFEAAGWAVLPLNCTSLTGNAQYQRNCKLGAEAHVEVEVQTKI